jgi:hypothetical protein
VALGEAVVVHPEPPVRIATGEPAVGGDLVHPVVVQDLEAGLEEIEPVVAGVLFDLDLDVPQVRREARRLAHGRRSLTAFPVFSPVTFPCSRRS